MACDLPATPTGWRKDEFESFIDYEAKLDPVIASNRMLAICSYSSEKFGMREIFDAISNDDFALIRESGRWEVFTQLCVSPGGEMSCRESEARLRATVEGVNDGIFTLDQTGTILLANPAALRMFGYRRVRGARQARQRAGARSNAR